MLDNVEAILDHPVCCELVLTMWLARVYIGLELELDV